MFIPIGTDRPTRRRPRIVEGLIIVNMLVYLAGLMTESFGFGSLDELMQRLELSRGDFHILSLFSYQFAHSPSDILHLLFNMLGLWIFGTALNDRLGHLSFLAFYLIGGAVAGIAHMIDSPAPVIGASGSVCALIGGFIALFPRSRIRLLVLFFIIGIFEVASLWVVGFYVLIDFVGWVGPSDSPVAYVAHFAGYLYGFFLALLLLMTNVLPKDDFDVLHLLRQKRRRSQWKQAVKHSQQGVIEKPSALNSKAQQRIHDLRTELNQRIRDEDWAGAATGWTALGTADDDVCLPEAAQLELANRLFATEHRLEASTAYERYLKLYSNSPKISEVKLMLGLLYARDLQRPGEAVALLESAQADLTDEGQRTLARTLLAELESAP
ncbi:MAG: rhomboid family intramembrane serine protease [Phycisphaerales bacterium]|nr:rhomboid family intramembrane serine protease [Phycisphaerales bacterium]